MAEEKYTALFVDQIFELHKRLFKSEKDGFFISNRTLNNLFASVREHLARGFADGSEQVTLRLMQNKLEGFRDELLRDARQSEEIRGGDQRPVRIISEEIGEKALSNWCERPVFE